MFTNMLWKTISPKRQGYYLEEMTNLEGVKTIVAMKIIRNKFGELGYFDNVLGFLPIGCGCYPKRWVKISLRQYTIFKKYYPNVYCNIFEGL